MQGTRRTFLQGTGTAVGSLVGLSQIPVTRAEPKAQIPVSERERVIIGNFVSIYQAVPDQETERLAKIWQFSNATTRYANEVLASIPNIGSVQDLENIAEPLLGVLRNVTENLVDVYGLQIDSKYLDRALSAVGYLPLLAQIWNVVQISTAIQNAAPSKDQFVQARDSERVTNLVDEFYISLLLLLTEVVLLLSGATYVTAFKSTRKIANLGLVRVREIVGVHAYSVLLSIVHWLQRGLMESTATYVVEKTSEVAADFDEETNSNFSKLTTGDVHQSMAMDTKGILEKIGSPFLDETDVIDETMKKKIVTQYDEYGIFKSDHIGSGKGDMTILGGIEDLLKDWDGV